MTDGINQTTPPKRSRTLLSLTALLVLFQFGAVVRTLNAPYPNEVHINLSIPFELIASLLWMLAALAVFVLLWARVRGAKLYAAWLAVGFSIYSLLRLLLFSQADYDRGRFPFLAVMLAIILFVPVAYIVRHRHVSLSRNGEY